MRPAPDGDLAVTYQGLDDIDMFDAANAEEMFLTSTSLCIAGVRSFNGAKIGDGRAPGSMTKRLTDAYIAEVGCDFVKQYLDRLS